MTFGVILIILMSFYRIVNSALTCKYAGYCGCEMSSRRKAIDLSPLAKGPAPLFKNVSSVGGSIQGTVEIDLCREFNCGGSQAKVCMKVDDLGASSYIPMGKDLSYLYDEDSRIVTFLYTSTNGVMRTYIAMHCSTASTGIGVINPVQLSDGNLYTSFDSQYACFVRSKHNLKFSPGTVLCILLIGFMLLYVVCGIAINKFVLKVEGPELFPNLSIWKNFFSLVAAGISFTFGRCKSKEEYEEI